MNPARPTAPADIRVEDIASHPHFVRLARIDGVPFDLRYAGTNNFAGRVLYEGIDCAWLRHEAAAGLQAAARWLATVRPGWRILVLDALRPQRVQEAIWAGVEGTADQLYFANPAIGSIHSWGMAVDATLLDEHGHEAHMGSGFDQMALVSHPALHAQHLAQGVLSSKHIEHRELLAAAMHEGGFAGIATEWWHFDHGQREQVRATLPRVV
jgi:zinc D-Ala-D-Ala dipeptidase